MITGKNYIGNSLSAKGNRTYKTFDPQKNEQNEAVFTEAAQEEIDNAVDLAVKAFRTYKDTSGNQRAAFLNAIADEILALGDALIEMYCRESGLPQGRANGERGRTVGQLKLFADMAKKGSWVQATIDNGDPNRTPLPKPDIRKMMEPLGPVVVFGASNFPFAFSTAGGDTASALAAGCPVIVKSHPMHAGTGEMVASAIIKAAEKTGMPNGVFSNLNSSGISVGERLVKHPGIKAVGFTGSLAGGRALFDLGAQRKEPIPVFAEMGSVNPVVILPHAAKEKGVFWAKNYAGSITLGTGQFCTNAGLILGIKSGDLDEFIQSLGKEIKAIDPTCMLHPKIEEAYEKKKQKAISQDGTTVVAEMETPVSDNHARQAVATVKGSTFLNNDTLHQEVFGPYSLVVQCADKEELMTILENLEGQLTGTILAENDDAVKYKDVTNALKNRVGRLIYNGVPTGVEVCAAMQHGGPYPASTDSRFTAVGNHAINRWVRPVSYQDWPNELLPDALKNDNPLGITRWVDGKLV